MELLEKLNIKDSLLSFRFRKRVLALADSFIVFTAGLISHTIFYGFNIYMLPAVDVLMGFIFDAVFAFGGLLLFGCYNKLWRYFKPRDYLDCVKGLLVGLGLAVYFFSRFKGYLPLRYATVHFVISCIGVCGFRYLFKGVFITLVNTGRNMAKQKKTLIVGAGRSCRLLLEDMFASENSKDVNNDNPGSEFLPVCIVDDDRTKLGMRIKGVEVQGTTGDIPKLCELLKIELIIFAIPSCPAVDRQKILNLCTKTNLPIKVLPYIGDILENSVSMVRKMQDIKVEDLLGREPIKFDNQDIRDFIENKVCMVTGGGGSIGSELVRQIAKYNPKQVVIVDIYENNAYEIQQELVMEYGDKLNLVTLIASVRDYFRMNQIFKKYAPDLIFHAAAHKHVPLMENSPMEAIKNNVIGTFNMATLAHIHHVPKFVMISTDKAVNPTNVMGASKRCCEMIVQYMAQQNGNHTDFVTTRFGNVLGSNGSVIPLFKRQIEQGKPVTVTHPDIIRYFMTIPEAVSLVMEAASIAHGGEIFVLDMGQPVKIVTLAENIIRMYGKVPYKDVEIKFTGLRPGEKIKEELLMSEEGLQSTKNKLIFIGKQLQIDTDKFIQQLSALKQAAAENDDAVAIRALHEIVPTFTTPEEFNKTIMMKAV